MSGRTASGSGGGAAARQGGAERPCWLGAPASLLLCPSSASPSPGPPSGKRPGPGHQPPPPSLLPPQPDGELGLWNCLRKERGGGKEEWWEAAEVQDPSPLGGATVPTWSLPELGGRGWTAEVEASVSRTPAPRPGRPHRSPHSHLGGLYLFRAPGSAASPGRGWAPGLYRINTNPDGAGLFAVASDPPSPQRPACCPPRSPGRVGDKICGRSLRICHLRLTLAL